MATKNLTLDIFKDKIFDFSTQKEWKFSGDKPAIIDFYADWCGPCKMIAPVLEELAAEYDGKVDIYKVNTEVERELAGVFRIRSIPTLFFIPQEGTPKMQAGVLSKTALVNAIETELLNK